MADPRRPEPHDPTKIEVAKEEAAIHAVIERLQRRFPERSRQELEAVVAGRYHDFDRAPIRDFVPILVEHSAIDNLMRTTAPRHRG